MEMVYEDTSHNGGGIVGRGKGAAQCGIRLRKLRELPEFSMG
jgi:hypothetical protein